MIGKEAGNAASLLASMRGTETELLLKCRNPDEPRTLSKVNQVGLILSRVHDVNNKFAAAIFFHHTWFDTSAIAK